MKGVFVLAASSRPWVIDPAILRPGRIDVHLFLDYPNFHERKEILQIATKEDYFIKNLNIDFIALKLDGFSSCDVISLLKETRLSKINE